MTDIELLPLPRWMETYRIPGDDFHTGPYQYLSDRMQAYARANLAPLQAEIEALRAENEAMKRCAIKYLGWLGVTHMPLDQALHDDMCNPSMCGDAALSKENSND